MCFGGNQAPAPRAPEIKYVGPSEDDIRRNEESLQQFQNQMQQQNMMFQQQLQQQIDAANQEYSDLESQYASDLGIQQQGADAATAEALTAEQAAAQAEADAAAAAAAAQQQAAQDQAAAAAAGAFQQAGAYQVSTTESDPINTQQTAAITEKKKPKTTLKIGQNTVAATAGTGLNIGT